MKCIPPLLVGTFFCVAGPVAGQTIEQLVDIRQQTAAIPGQALSRLATRTQPAEGPLSSLGRATEWLNSPPLTTAALQGKVVVIDFWTYTCINWQRSLPYVRAWAAKYKDNGLVVVGVHSPEFAFERDQENVRRATAEMRIDYPVAIDNNLALWRAFSNQYWPALYFIDAAGRVRQHQFGEGDYEQAERVIQQLLVEAGRGGFDPEFVRVDPHGAELGADLTSLKSPETYLGYGRSLNFSSPGVTAPEKDRLYSLPKGLRLNHWGLVGNWTVRRESIVLNKADGRIAIRFHARDLHLVMGPTVRGSTVRFRILIDGHAPGDSHGEDVDDHGYGTLANQRLYQLVRQAGPVTDRLFEIEFLDPGAEAFSLTFG